MYNPDNNDDNNKKKLKKILIRYYPPGIILKFEDNEKVEEEKSVDLLNINEKYFIFNFSTDIDYIVDQIIIKEPTSKSKRKTLEAIIKSK